MAVVLVTGMSGTGKSAVLAELARRGHRVVETDYGGYSEEVDLLFVSGCVANQAKFYPRFDAVVLLSAPADVILERVAMRASNDFGKTDAERHRILEDLATVEPLLRAGATAEIDTRAPLAEVVAELERIAEESR